MVVVCRWFYDYFLYLRLVEVYLFGIFCEHQRKIDDDDFDSTNPRQFWSGKYPPLPAVVEERLPQRETNVCAE